MVTNTIFRQPGTVLEVRLFPTLVRAAGVSLCEARYLSLDEHHCKKSSGPDFSNRCLTWPPVLLK